MQIKKIKNLTFNKTGSVRHLGQISCESQVNFVINTFNSVYLHPNQCLKLKFVIFAVVFHNSYYSAASGVWNMTHMFLCNLFHFLSKLNSFLLHIYSLLLLYFLFDFSLKRNVIKS